MEFARRTALALGMLATELLHPGMVYGQTNRVYNVEYPIQGDRNHLRIQDIGSVLEFTIHCGEDEKYVATKWVKPIRELRQVETIVFTRVQTGDSNTLPERKSLIMQDDQADPDLTSGILNDNLQLGTYQLQYNNTKGSVGKIGSENH